MVFHASLNKCTNQFKYSLFRVLIIAGPARVVAVNGVIAKKSNVQGRLTYLCIQNYYILILRWNNCNNIILEKINNLSESKTYLLCPYKSLSGLIPAQEMVASSNGIGEILSRKE